MSQHDFGVGLFTPYGHVETAYAACSLYRTLQSMGFQTTLITPDPDGQDVHHMCDRDVKSLRKRSIESCGIRHQHMLWLTLRPVELATLRRIEPGQTHTLVVTRDDLRYKWHNFNQYNYVICTRKDVYDAVKRRIKRQHWTVQPIFVPWESELPLLGRAATSVNDTASLLAVFERETRNVLDKLLMLQRLMVKFKELNVTVWHTASWGAAEYTLLKEMRKSLTPRFRLERSPQAIRRWDLFRQHDFAWFVPRHYDVASLVADALACHCPVIAYDVPPFNHFIVAGRNGYLVDCPKKTDQFGIVTARDASDKLMQVLERCLLGDELRRQRSAEWPQQETRRRDYHQGWRNLFEGVVADDYEL